MSANITPPAGNMSTSATNSDPLIFKWVVVSLQLFIILASLALNSLLLVVLNKSKLFSESSAVFIKTLTVADMLIAVLTVPIDILLYSVMTSQKVLDRLCKLTGLVLTLTLFVWLPLVLSASTQLLIAIDRMVATVWSNTYGVVLTTKRAYFAVLVTWCLACVIPAANVLYVAANDDGTVNACLIMATLDPSLGTLLIVVGSTLPLLLSFAIYVYIVHKIKKQTAVIPVHQPATVHLANVALNAIKRRNQLTKSMVIILLGFTIAVLPYTIITLTSLHLVLDIGVKEAHMLGDIAVIFLYASSMINPIVLMATNARVRKRSREIITTVTQSVRDLF